MRHAADCLRPAQRDDGQDLSRPAIPGGGGAIGRRGGQGRRYAAAAGRVLVQSAEASMRHNAISALVAATLLAIGTTCCVLALSSADHRLDDRPEVRYSYRREST